MGVPRRVRTESASAVAAWLARYVASRPRGPVARLVVGDDPLVALLDDAEHACVRESGLKRGSPEVRGILDVKAIFPGARLVQIARRSRGRRRVLYVQGWKLDAQGRLVGPAA